MTHKNTTCTAAFTAAAVKAKGMAGACDWMSPRDTAILSNERHQGSGNRKASVIESSKLIQSMEKEDDLSPRDTATLSNESLQDSGNRKATVIESRKLIVLLPPL